MDSITLIRRERVLDSRRDLIIKREKVFENLIKAFNIRIWIRVFDAFDDTNENEEYEKECEKKTSILENDLSDKKILYKESFFQIKRKQRIENSYTDVRNDFFYSVYSDFSMSFETIFFRSFIFYLLSVFSNTHFILLHW